MLVLKLQRVVFGHSLFPAFLQESRYLLNMHIMEAITVFVQLQTHLGLKSFAAFPCPFLEPIPDSKNPAYFQAWAQKLSFHEAFLDFMNLGGISRVPCPVFIEFYLYFIILLSHLTLSESCILCPLLHCKLLDNRDYVLCIFLSLTKLISMNDFHLIRLVYSLVLIHLGHLFLWRSLETCHFLFFLLLVPQQLYVHISLWFQHQARC